MPQGKMSTRLAWYALAVMLGSFTGCSCESEKMSMVNPEAVHQSYIVSYNADVNRAEASARFRFGGATGTNLELDGIAKVTHSSCELKKAHLFGVYYAGNCAGHNVDQVFEFTDTAGKNFKNTIKLLAIEFPANMRAEMSRAKGITVVFAGDAVAQDEHVELTINQNVMGVGDAKGGVGQSRSKTIQNRTVGATEIAVTAGDLQEFSDGDATLTLKRVRNHAPQNVTSRGGHMSATYVAKERRVVMVK